MITVSHLTKRYGSHIAVDDLSFKIEEGHIYGFLGPNGAGKSTTMNILTGCLAATSGEVRIGEYDIFEEPLKAKKLIGYLPELPPLYTDMTALEYLKFVGRAKGLKGTALKESIAYAVNATGIESMKKRLIRQLSKGYRQRVGIAQALLGSPEVIILDEPTVGLDPRQIIEIRNLIKELGKKHTVILSSHVLAEISAVCDRILIISNGRLVANEEAETLTRSSSLGVKVRADSLQQLTACLEGLDNVSAPKEDGGLFCFRIGITGDPHILGEEISRRVCSAGLGLCSIAAERTGLEEIFLQLTGGFDLPHSADAENQKGGENE